MFFVLSIIAIAVALYNIINEEVRSKKLILCIIYGLLLLLIYGSLSIYDFPVADLERYKYSYENYSYYSIKDLLYTLVYINTKDPVYFLTGYICSHLGLDFEIWRVFIGILFISSFIFVVYKWSENELLSFIIILSLYFTFTFSGLRQTIALSFILLSYHFLLSNKNKTSVIFIIIAALFHLSALVFLLCYIPKFIKLPFGIIICTIVISPIFPIIGNGFVRMIFSNYALNKQMLIYADREAALSWSGYIIQLCIIIFYIYFAKIKCKTECSDFYLNCMMIGLCFQSFAVVIAEMFRISYYFSICSILSIPYAISLVDKKVNKQLISIIIGIIFILYIVWTQSYSKFTFLKFNY